MNMKMTAVMLALCAGGLAQVSQATEVPNVGLEQISSECGFGGVVESTDEVLLVLPKPDGFSVSSNYLYQIKSCPNDQNKILVTIGKVSDGLGTGPQGGRFILTWYEAGRSRATWFKNRNSGQAEIIVSFHGGRYAFQRYKGLQGL